MNWQNNMNNLFTLAHEFGHSVHSYYTSKNQPIHMQAIPFLLQKLLQHE